MTHVILLVTASYLWLYYAGIKLQERRIKKCAHIVC